MNTVFSSILLVLFCLSPANAQLPKEPAQYQEWQTKSLESIEKYRLKGDAEYLKALVKKVFVTRVPTPGIRPADQEAVIQPVREAARQALISLPSHADYFRDSLEVHLKSEEADVAGLGRVIDLDFSERAYLFRIMSHLQSPQIVALLGELLEDERNPAWKSHGDDGPSFANWWHSTEALGRLGIEGVPEIALRGTRDYEAAREQWRLWFAQVKAGNRTFRFKGNPQEYDLKGPVGAAFSDAALTKESPVPAASQAAGEEGPLRRWPLWVALGVLAVGAAVYVGKQRAA